VVSAPLGDSLANDRGSFGLVLFHHCYSCAYPLTHHHDAVALSILNLAPTPINPRGAMTSRPDIAAKPPAVNLDDPAQNSRGRVRI